MSTYTPRNMRKKYRNTSGKDQQKQKVFRAAALWSKQFIHQSADALQSSSLREPYKKWCESADKGTLRRTTK